jgi:hypothetical protein
MKHQILALRINRRAIGVAVLTGDELTLTDGRHLPSTSHRAINSSRRWLSYWLERIGDADIVLDTPTLLTGTTMSAVVDDLSRLLSERHIVPISLTKADVLAAYGLRPVRSRQEVRQIVSEFWPRLPQTAGRVRPYVMDAAAAALLAESRLRVGPPPT